MKQLTRILSNSYFFVRDFLSVGLFSHPAATLWGGARSSNSAFQEEDLSYLAESAGQVPGPGQRPWISIMLQGACLPFGWS